MIDSWNSIELASLSFEFKLWKIHLLFFFVDFFVRIQSFSTSILSFREKIRSKKYTISLFFFVFFNNFRFFSFQLIFRLFRRDFSWIFVFRHFKFRQECYFHKSNFEFKHFHLEFKFFQFKNSKFLNRKSRSENLEKVFNKQLNSSMFKFLNFSISIASVQFFPWKSTRSEKKNVATTWQKTNWKLSHITLLLNEMGYNDF